MRNYPNINLHAIALEAMKKYGFQPKFPEAVIQEVTAINEKLLLKEQPEGIKDLRFLLWSSIDNVDSLDIDQLEYCELGTNQEILIKVAIADVDLFAPKKSRTDGQASVNGTSVYTGIDIFPLLPQRLSTNLSSLLVGHDRLAVIIEFAVLADGGIRQGDVYRALVRNKAQLVYEEIGDWLEKKAAPPFSLREISGLEEQLRVQDEAARRLRKFRVERGTLEFDTIEAKPILQEGIVLGLIVPRKNQARYLVENFMIAANETIAAFLEKAGFPMIQRVVRAPKNWTGIADVAHALGETLPPEPDSKALSQFLLRRKETAPERFPDLSLTIIKLLGAGEYMYLEPGKTNYGHFGLAVMDYTHATAPNRRYADIIIQRLVKAALGIKQPVPYTPNDLIEYASRCTDRDKAARKVERFMRKIAAAILLSKRIGESFTAIVTGASEKGTYVRLITPPAEGRVIRGEKGMFVGQKVNVRLISMDPYQGYIDFESISNK